MTEAQHTPTKHSNVVGGSSAARVLACPASVKLLWTLPKDETESPYAAEGTALHNAVEHCLYEGLGSEDADALVGKEFYGIALSQKQVDDCVKPAMDMFDAIYEELLDEVDGDEDKLRYGVETEVQFPGIEDAFGTADILMTNGKRSIVLDWKFGGGVPVSAEENKQMSYYACGAFNTAPKFMVDNPNKAIPDDWPVEYIIVQPRINAERPSRWPTTFGALQEFHAALVAAADEALNDDDPRYGRGDHCRWCRAGAVCPAYRKAGEKLAALVAGDKKLDTKSKEGKAEVKELVEEALDADFVAAEMNNLPEPELLADWLHKADIVEFWVKAVREFAFKEAEEGRAPQGMKLVEKTGNLAYASDEYATNDKMLANKGLSAAERRKTTLITPTQANALLKKKGKKPLTDKQAGRFVTGKALVPIDDPRKAVTPNAERAKLAAKGLKKLQVG